MIGTAPDPRARLAGLVASPPALAVLLFGLDLAAVLLRPDGARIAVWWPGAGVAAAAAATSAGTRPSAVLVAVFCGSAAASLVTGRPPLVAGLFAVANVVEAALVGFWLGRGGRPRLVTMADLGRLLAVATAGALVGGGGIAITQVVLRGGDLLHLWWALAASHGAAVLLLVPLVMELPRRSVAVGRWELAALWTAVPLAAVVVFAPQQRLPLAFLPVAALVWTGLRLGVRTAVAQLLVVGVLATVLTAGGGGPFAEAGGSVSSATAASLVQLFLIACALVVLVVAASVAQREAALVALADQRSFDQAVLEVVNAGVLACDAEGAIVVRNAAHRRITGVGDGERVTCDEVAGRLEVRMADGSEVRPTRPRCGAPSRGRSSPPSRCGWGPQAATCTTSWPPRGGSTGPTAGCSGRWRRAPRSRQSASCRRGCRTASRSGTRCSPPVRT